MEGYADQKIEEKSDAGIQLPASLFMFHWTIAIALSRRLQPFRRF